MKLSVLILLVILVAKSTEGTERSLLRINNEARQLKKDDKKDDKKEDKNKDKKDDNNKDKNKKDDKKAAKEKDVKFRPDGQGTPVSTHTTGAWNPNKPPGGQNGVGTALNVNTPPGSATVATAGTTVGKPTIAENSQGNDQAGQANQNENWAAQGFDVAPQGCEKANKPNWEWKVNNVMQMYKRLNQCDYDDHCASGCCMVYQLGWKCCQDPLKHMACSGTCAAQSSAVKDEAVVVDEKPGKL